MEFMSAELCCHCGNAGRSEEMSFSSDAEGWICDECQASCREAAAEMYAQFRVKLAEVKAEISDGKPQWTPVI